MVCLLDVASLQSKVAVIKAEIESFFIAGSARIDLIAKVMDLDNDIGGYNFDIPVLIDTEKAITDIGKSPGIYMRIGLINLCLLINQSIRQSIKQSVNQSTFIYQSVSQSNIN